MAFSPIMIWATWANVAATALLQVGSLFPPAMVHALGPLPIVLQQAQQPCGRCGGHGYLQDPAAFGMPCPACGGTGYVTIAGGAAPALPLQEPVKTPLPQSPCYDRRPEVPGQLPDPRVKGRLLSEWCDQLIAAQSDDADIVEAANHISQLARDDPKQAVRAIGALLDEINTLAFLGPLGISSPPWDWRNLADELRPLPPTGEEDESIPPEAARFYKPALAQSTLKMAAALVNIGAPAIPWVAWSISWQNDAARHFSLAILQNLGPAAAATTDCLLPLLACGEESLESHALVTLAAFGTDAAIAEPNVAAMLQRHPDPREVLEVLRTLRAIGISRTETTVRLAAFLFDTEPQFRDAAAEALATAKSLGPELILRVLSQDDTALAVEALNALAGRAAERFTTQASTVFVERVAHLDDDAEVRELLPALVAVSKRAPRPAQPAADALTHRLGVLLKDLVAKGDEVFVPKILAVLGGLAVTSSHARAILFETAITSGSWGEAAVEQFDGLNPDDLPAKERRPTALVQLGSRKEEIRAHAIEVLRADPPSEGLLLEYFSKDRFEDVRIGVLRILVDLGATEEDTLQMFQSLASWQEGTLEERLLALKGLGAAKGPRAAQGLLEVLKEVTDPRVCEQALKELESVGLDGVDSAEVAGVLTRVLNVSDVARDSAGGMLASLDPSILDIPARLKARKPYGTISVDKCQEFFAALDADSSKGLSPGELRGGGWDPDAFHSSTDPLEDGDVCSLNDWLLFLERSLDEGADVDGVPDDLRNACDKVRAMREDRSFRAAVIQDKQALLSALGSHWLGIAKDEEHGRSAGLSLYLDVDPAQGQVEGGFGIAMSRGRRGIGPFAAPRPVYSLHGSIVVTETGPGLLLDIQELNGQTLGDRGLGLFLCRRGRTLSLESEERVSFWEDLPPVRLRFILSRNAPFDPGSEGTSPDGQTTLEEAITSRPWIDGWVWGGEEGRSEADALPFRLTLHREGDGARLAGTLDWPTLLARYEVEGDVGEGPGERRELVLKESDCLIGNVPSHPGTLRLTLDEAGSRRRLTGTHTSSQTDVQQVLAWLDRREPDEVWSPLIGPGVELAGANITARSPTREPFLLRLAHLDPWTGAVIGEIEWPGLDSRHALAGRLLSEDGQDDETLTFVETKALAHGRAALGVRRTLRPLEKNGRLVLTGEWTWHRQSGTLLIPLRQSAEDEALQAFLAEHERLVGVCLDVRAGKDVDAGFAATIQWGDPVPGHLSGRIEWGHGGGSNELAGYVDGSSGMATLRLTVGKRIAKGSFGAGMGMQIELHLDASGKTHLLCGSWTRRRNTGEVCLISASDRAQLAGFIEEDDLKGTCEIPKDRRKPRWPFHIALHLEPDSLRVTGEIAWDGEGTQQVSGELVPGPAGPRLRLQLGPKGRGGKIQKGMLWELTPVGGRAGAWKGSWIRGRDGGAVGFDTP